jgi:hypothetical protein
VKEVAEHGWRKVKENASGYYVMHCYCGKHYTNLHKTPSNPDHFRKRARYMIGLCSMIRDEAEGGEAGRGNHS